MASNTTDSEWIVHGPALPFYIAEEAVIVSAVFIPLVIAAMGFRIYAQRYARAYMTADDYFLITATVIIIGLAASTIYCALMAGLGWYPQQLIGWVRETFVRMLFASQILWGTSLVLVRAGLLMFYRRLFTTPSFRTATTVVLTINVLWYITFLIGMFVKYRWTGATQQVIDFPPWLVAQSVLDVAQDILTLVLPLFVIRSLNMKLRRKILVSAIFGFGFVCIAASLVRLKYMVELKQIYEDKERYTCVTYRVYIWSVIQPCISLITACLPGFAPAFTSERNPGKFFMRAKSLVSSISSSSDGSRTQDSAGRGSFHSSNALRTDFSIEKTVGWSVRHASSDEIFADMNASSYHLQTTTRFEHPG